MAQLLGINQVIRNLNSEIKTIEGRTTKGLIKAAIIIMNDTENTSPVTPLDTGNLRASRFIVASGLPVEGSKPQFEGEDSGKLISDHNNIIQSSKVGLMKRTFVTVMLGFTAFYAFFVHENVGANFKQPTKGARGRAGGAGAKFFEASFRRNTNKVLSIIQREARIR